MSSRDLLSEQGLRLDGRRANELRKIKCKLGIFSLAGMFTSQYIVIISYL